LTFEKYFVSLTQIFSNDKATKNMIKLSTIIPNPNNPRLIKDDKFEKLCKSIQEFPAMMALRPMVTDVNNVVLGGNMRLKALLHLGYKEVPDEWIKKASELTEDEVRRFIIADNVGFGEHDWELLRSDWDLNELEDWGVDVPEFESEVLEAEEDDYEIPDTIETDIVLGDLFEIGVHRLLCGDSTCSDTVAKLMGGEKADMVFTDPPYGMNLDTDYTKINPSSEKSKKFAEAKGETTNKNYSKVLGDNDDFTPELINTIFACFNDVKEIFIWGADYFAELLPNKNEGSWVVWDKRTNDDGSNLDEMFGSCFELCWSKNKHKRDIARIKYAGLFGTEREDIKKRLHPTQKPILLSQWFFNKWGKENDLIADLFLGSGSTMVAAHQLNRKCYGIELDPKYCQVIIDRMLKLDPALTITKNGQPYA
jgi:site-specific DNA-methyltransferase (adenine-specific)